MLISTKGRYVTRMLADIAMHQGSGYVPMKDVAARQQISKKYIESLTAPLAEAGILGIRRGQAGGYRLLVPPEEVTLWRIVSLTDKAAGREVVKAGQALNRIVCYENTTIIRMTVWMCEESY